MSITRRSALGYASGLAVASGIANPGLAATMRRARGAAREFAHPQTAQRFNPLVIHRDEAGGTPHFATLWIKSADTAWMAINTQDDASYREAFDKYRLRGYRLRRINAFQTKNGMRYAAIWQLASGPQWQASHGMTLAQFDEASAQNAQQGYRLSYIDACGTQDGARYSAIWEHADGPAMEAATALTDAEYRQKFAALTAQGFRVRQISSYAAGGESRFAAIFEKSAGPTWEADHRMTAPAFRQKSDAMAANGYRLIDVSGHAIGEIPAFSGIWEKA